MARPRHPETTLVEARPHCLKVFTVVLWSCCVTGTGGNRMLGQKTFSCHSIQVPRLIKTTRRGDRIGLAGALALILIALVSLPASAQFSSGQPIRIIVPFAPAGSSDVLARVLQSPFSQALSTTLSSSKIAPAPAAISGPPSSPTPDPTGTLSYLRAAPSSPTPRCTKVFPTTPRRILRRSQLSRSLPISW